MSLLCTAAFQAETARAEGHVEVVIRETTRPPQGDKIRIDVTFLNTGDEPVFLHKPSTPFGRTDDALSGDQFVVTDESGNRIPYTGSSAGYWGPPRLSHFVKIMPGESTHKEVDLGASYEFRKAGDFKVRFTADLGQQPDPDYSTPEERDAFVSSAQQGVVSNEIVVHISQIRDTAERSTNADEGKCDAAQIARLDEALPVAHDKATRAYAFLVTDSYPFSIIGGEMVYRYVPKRRFERWFGAPPASSPLPHDFAAWDASDSGEVKNTIGHLAGRLSLVSGSVITPRCGCEGFSPEAMARAEDHNPYVVRFCPAFSPYPSTAPGLAVPA